jgi:hypothetical protein
VRRAKSAAHVSVRAPVDRLRVRLAEDAATILRHAAVDLALAAGATHVEIRSDTDAQGALVEVRLAAPRSLPLV